MAALPQMPNLTMIIRDDTQLTISNQYQVHNHEKYYNQANQQISLLGVSESIPVRHIF